MRLSGAKEIASLLEALFPGRQISQRSIKWFSQRPHDPLPVSRALGRLVADEAAVREWAERQTAGGR